MAEIRDLARAHTHDAAMLASPNVGQPSYTGSAHNECTHWRTVAGPIIAGKRSSCMKQRKEGVAVWRLDQIRYAMAVDQVIRYVGSQEECQRRAEILLPKNTRDIQDRALARACRIGGNPSL